MCMQVCPALPSPLLQNLREFSYRHMPVDIRRSRVFSPGGKAMTFSILSPQGESSYAIQKECANLPLPVNMSHVILQHWNSCFPLASRVENYTSESLYFEVSKFKLIILHMKAVWISCQYFCSVLHIAQ